MNNIKDLISKYDMRDTQAQKIIAGVALYEQYKDEPIFLSMLDLESSAKNLYHSIQSLVLNKNEVLLPAMAEEEGSAKGKLKTAFADHENRIDCYSKQYRTLVIQGSKIAQQFGYAFFNKRI